LQKKNSSQKWAIALFTIGVFMAGLDNGIISSALTTIYNSFGVSPTWGAWAVTIYTLGVAISVPIIGKLSDNYGRKRLFIIEILLFGIGSLFVAISPNFTVLLVARFIQAIGGGGIFIIGTSHVLATLPKNQQGKVLGLLGGMHGLSAVVGPNVGAVILHITGTWEWMFLINIPIALFLIVMGMNKIDESKQPSSKALDLTGTIYLSLGIVALMFGITNIDSMDVLASLMSVTVFPYIIAGILLIYLFLKHEKQLELRGGDPIISYSLLEKRSFLFTLLLGFLSGGFLASIIFIPSYVQQALQVPAENAGFWLTPLALASGIGAGLGGFLTDRIGAKRTIIVSGIIGLSGFLMFFAFVTNFTTFIVASVLSGIGLGFLLGAPLNVLVGESAKKDQYGTSIGTLSLTRQIGLTLFPTIFASFITSGVMKIEPTFQATFGETIISFQNVDRGEGYDEVISEIMQIEDALLQDQLLSIVAHVMKNGFQDMFFVAVLISMLVIIISTYLYMGEKKSHFKRNSGN